jgi:hypothetical protein
MTYILMIIETFQILYVLGIAPNYKDEYYMMILRIVTIIVKHIIFAVL